MPSRGFYGGGKHVSPTLKREAQVSAIYRLCDEFNEGAVLDFLIHCIIRQKNIKPEDVPWQFRIWVKGHIV